MTTLDCAQPLSILSSLILTAILIGSHPSETLAQRPAQERSGSGADRSRVDTTFEERRSELYHENWIDFNKNGERDPYEDATLPVAP